jgi:tRNA pseudouridine38-40 synthase
LRNVRLLIAYDGSPYFGWQRQDGFDSVQQRIEEALLAVTGVHASVQGAGRTDTGVHALGQVAHVHVETRLGDEELRRALSAHLPGSVVVRSLETCREDFHARFSAVSKRYAYWTATTRSPPPFSKSQIHWTPSRLDFDRMRAAASPLLGRHDFAAFSSTGSPRASTVREVQRIHFLVRRHRFAFVIQADGFLYNMVRAIVGTLLDVGRGRFEPVVVARALEGAPRSTLGPTAPAAGLYLLSIQYAEDAFVARERALDRNRNWPQGMENQGDDDPSARQASGTE